MLIRDSIMSCLLWGNPLTGHRPRLAPGQSTRLTSQRFSVLAAIVNESKFHNKQGKIIKSAVTKLKVAELQIELQQRGLESTGLKANLVLKLLSALEQEAQTTLTARATHEHKAPPGNSQLLDATRGGTTQAVSASSPFHSSAGSTAPDQHQPVDSRLHFAPTPSQGSQPHKLSVTPAAAVDTASQSTLGASPRSTSRPVLRSHAPPTAASKGATGPIQGPADPVAATGLAVTWLGTSSGAPSAVRNVSSIAFRVPGGTYLVDAGEGTFNQINKARMDPATIKRVFITHMHGDHCFGLVGVLRAIAAARMHQKPPAAEPDKGSGHPHDTLPAVQLPVLRVYGPPGVQAEVVSVLRLAGVDLPAQLEFPAKWAAECSAGGTCSAVTAPILFSCADGKVVSVWACKRKPGSSLLYGPQVYQYAHAPNLPRAKEEDLQIGSCRLSLRALAPDQQDVEGVRPVSQQAATRGRETFRALQGLTWTIPCSEDKVTVTAAQLQHRVPCWGYVFQEDNVDGRKVVLLGDTMESGAIADAGHQCDLLSHEATFARGMEVKAQTAQHSTAAMAGTFARQLQARMLVLTHFSRRYDMMMVTQGPRDGPRDHQRGSFRGAPHDKEASEPVDDELDEAFDSSNVQSLLQEARAAFGSSNVVAAEDTFTVQVPKRGGSSATGAPTAQMALGTRAALVQR